MVYISGKITGTDDYIERFSKAESELIDKGYKVINPAKVNSGFNAATYKMYMQSSINMLFMCDCIYMLKGWEDSKGARAEKALAESMDYYIFYEG